MNDWYCVDGENETIGVNTPQKKALSRLCHFGYEWRTVLKFRLRERFHGVMSTPSVCVWLFGTSRGDTTLLCPPCRRHCHPCQNLVRNLRFPSCEKTIIFSCILLCHCLLHGLFGRARALLINHHGWCTTSSQTKQKKK